MATLSQTILTTPGAQEITLLGRTYLVTYETAGAVGDNGLPVCGDVTGEYEVRRGDRVLLRQHVSPYGTSGYGNASALRYGAERVAEAILRDLGRWPTRRG